MTDRLADQLPGNPFAELVDTVLDVARSQNDMSEENIGRIVEEAFTRTSEPPEDLFDERPSLSRIRDYARSRLVAPKAVLPIILLNVGTDTPAHVMIPPMVGSPKPVNMVVVTVGPSGLGKTAAEDVADDYWPTNFPTYPFGTAEGTVQAFQPDEDGQPQVPNIKFASSEIDNWAALGERAGSMTFPVLRQIVTGDQLGQKNASKAHTRVVAKRSYRAGVSLSAQPESSGTAILFRDAPGGFPQRCLFGIALDPDAPDDPPQDVEPYRPQQQPDWTPNAGAYYEVPFPDTVIAEIQDHRRRVLRGDPTINPLDGHRGLTKAKVSVTLAILEGRNYVTEDDWRVAGRILAESDAIRASLIRATEDAARTANRAKALATADRDEVVASTKTARTKNTLLKHLTDKRELPRHELRKRLRSDQRENFDAAITELIDEGKVFATGDDNATVYQIAADDGHPSTWTVSPRLNPQVIDRGHKVHVDNPGTVTDLHTRRSPDTGRPLVPCPKWLALHIADLRAAGNTTTQSLAVVEAGQALGYTKQAILQAAHNNPDIAVVARTQKSSTWSLTGDAGGYKPATEWVHEYFDALPANTTTVDQDAFRAAAEARNYSWTAARAAAYRSGRIDKTGDGWHIINQVEDGTAS